MITIPAQSIPDLRLQAFLDDQPRRQLHQIAPIGRKGIRTQSTLQPQRIEKPLNQDNILFRQPVHAPVTIV